MIRLIIILLVLSGCAVQETGTITGRECHEHGGTITLIQDDGSACQNKETDAGTVSDVDCRCRCCIPS